MSKWTSNLENFLGQLPARYRPWLEKPYRLTQAFEAMSQQAVGVRRLSEQMGPPLPEEAQRMRQAGIHFAKPYIRKVYLLGGGKPWCYARVVLPEQTYAHFKDDFDTLGDRPLGNTVLYVRDDLRRSPFEYTCVEKGSALYSLSVAHLSAPCSLATLWGRRSLFWMGEYPLLVTEIFLSELPEYAEVANDD